MNLFEKIGFIKSKEEQEIEELAYKKAAKELSEGAYNEGLKAKAYSQSNGDEKKADAIYIKLRAKQLIKKVRNKRKTEYRNSPEYQKKLKYRQKQDKKAIYIFFSSILAMLLLGLIINYDEVYSGTIKINDAEIIEPYFRIEGKYTDDKASIFSGRIHNQSDYTINSISLRIRLFRVNYTLPEFETGQSFTLEELKKPLSPSWVSEYTFKDNLDDKSLELVGKQIDSEDLKIKNLRVPSGETKSIRFENIQTKLNGSDYWVWDYEILNVYSY